MERLEYDESRDTTFCFACRVYLTESKSEYKRDAFSTTGFTDWHHATGQNKGFNQQCSPAAHKAAMLLYHDHIEGVKKGEQVGVTVIHVHLQNTP